MGLIKTIKNLNKLNQFAEKLDVFIANLTEFYNKATQYFEVVKKHAALIAEIKAIVDAKTKTNPEEVNEPETEAGV